MRLIWLLAVGLVVTGLAGSSRADAEPVSQSAAPPRYVALGDSFAAGIGIAPAVPRSPAACGRSAHNYPHQVAQALKLQLVDVTCSGATTADMTAPQAADIAPQLNALTPDTALVTVTIGGNDLGFSTIAARCASILGPSGPVLSGAPNCTVDYAPNGHDELASRIDNQVAPAVASVLGGIRQRAPRAVIIVVGYLALSPDGAHTPSGGCWTNPLQGGNGLPLTTADLPYLYRVQAHLDEVLERQAVLAHAEMVRVFDASLSHTACAKDAWTNGVQLAGTSLLPSSLHPNAAGVSYLASVVAERAKAALAARSGSEPEQGSAGLSGPVWLVIGLVCVVLVVIAAVVAVRIWTSRRPGPRSHWIEG